MEFTGHPTRIQADHFPFAAVRQVLAWAMRDMADPKELLREDLVYLPKFGEISYCLIRTQLGSARSALELEPEHKARTSDGIDLFVGYRPEDVKRVLIWREGEMICLTWESGFAPGNRTWHVSYQGPDEGEQHERSLLQLILPLISQHFKYIAVTSYAARDAELVTGAGFSLPTKQSSTRSLIWLY